MAALQTVAFGAASDGSQGDSVRTGFTKDNANVAVLQTQAALTAYTGGTITAAQALTKVHVGQRVNINLATAGPVNVPVASTCGADNVLFLRNLGTTVVTIAITSGSGDTCALTKLNAGETALLDTDGVHTWSVLMRGRTNSDNEVVNGNCTVNGNETVSGTLTVTGAVSFPSTTAGSFGARPAFVGKTPWDSGNLADPMTLSGTQSVTGNKAFSGVVQATGNLSAVAASAGIQLYSTGGIAGLGFIVNNNSNGGTLFFDASNTRFAFVNSVNSGYANVICQTLTQASDRDLKTNVAPMRAVLPAIRNKRVVTYTMRPDPAGQVDTSPQIGVIAQEWREDFPELVQELAHDIDADGDFIAHQYDADGNEIYGPAGKPASRKALGFNYSNASAVALAAVLELDAALQSALARIATLEDKDSA